MVCSLLVVRRRLKYREGEIKGSRESKIMLHTFLDPLAICIFKFSDQLSRSSMTNLYNAAYICIKIR